MVFPLLTTPREAKSYAHKRQEVIEELLKTSSPVVRMILKSFLPRLEAFVPMRECGKHIFLKMFARVKDQLLFINKLLNEQGYLTQKRDIFFLTWTEIEEVVRQRIDRADVLRLVEKRKGEQEIYRQSPVPDIICESGERVIAPVEQSDVLSGESLSFGVVRATARVINDFSQSHKLRQGEILITHHADPGWTPLFTIASGVVIEVGGLICHAAMVARELGLPAVVIKGATTIIKDGQEIELDADSGKVTVLSKGEML